MDVSAVFLLPYGLTGGRVGSSAEPQIKKKKKKQTDALLQRNTLVFCYTLTPLSGVFTVCL